MTTLSVYFYMCDTRMSEGKSVDLQVTYILRVRPQVTVFSLCDSGQVLYDEGRPYVLHSVFVSCLALCQFVIPFLTCFLF